MTFWSDMDYEVHPVELDMETADRLLAGAVAPEDAPPGYAEVTRLLEAAWAEPTADELMRETEVVDLVAAAVRSSSTDSSSSRRSFMPFALSRPRISAALVAAALACSAGLASAGALPGAAQDIASDMLAKVGISVPGPADNAGTHPSGRGTSAVTPSNEGKGSGISELATTTELTGVEKGAEISTVASNGKSQAGQHGPESGSAASSADAPVTTPNTGGTGTADTASDGNSSAGTSTADTASGGNSSAGSGNASSGQETADTASGGHSSAGSDNSSSGQANGP
jgi:hypothetical protein